MSKHLPIDEPSSDSSTDVESLGTLIYANLDERPLVALSNYERLPQPIDPSLAERFSSVMEIIATARSIDVAADRETLVQCYALYRRRDQKRLMAAIVEHLFNLDSNGKWGTLHEIGRSAEPLVLEGTVQQQFFCKLASTLGVRSSVPGAVVRLVARPMICALRVVLRIGAETTRDAAIEGLGALLKLDGNPESRFAPDAPNEDDLGNPELNRQYAARLERRRDMVLAVAAPALRNDYVTSVRKPIETILAELRADEALIGAKGEGAEEQAKELARIHAEIQTALYGRADRLRILPAVLRQSDGADATDLVELLRAATVRLQSEKIDPVAVHIAYARYQESVFRTIDVAMRRSRNAWESFDEAIAEAVKRIPRTMAGPPAVCNARIRATIAILRTAMSLVKLSEETSKTKVELGLWVKRLGTASPWLNLGIVEGCYRGLPDILDKTKHSGLYKPALNALFKDLRAEPMPGDLAQSHRHLSALACFRRILITLADDAVEKHLQGGTHDPRAAETETLDRRLRAVLRTPDLETLQRVLRGRKLEGDPDDIAEPVISGIAFECDLLRKSRPNFQRWDTLSISERMILTRILALQMHAVSRDAVEIERYPFLNSVFTGMTAAIMPEAEALKVVWDILSSLPAGAAEAADPDIQRFVEYRGRRQRATHDPTDHAEDLPGYVLAMISPTASERIAGAISREIDLNLRHDRRHQRADLARSLYQVLLHGPHEAIFDHLLPRLRRGKYREMVMLFRTHVAAVRSSETVPDTGRYDVRILATHVGAMLRLLRQDWASDTLKELNNALQLFGDLVSSEEGEVWAAIENQKHLELFAAFDALDIATRGRDVPDVEGHRKPLQPIFHSRLIDLSSNVSHYISLPIGKFDERIELLRKAAETAHEIEKELAELEDLQPPEKIMLVALMQHLADVFERAKLWFCVEMRRAMDSEARDRFWILSAYNSDPVNLLMRRVRSGVAERSLRASYWQLKMWEEIGATSKVAGPLPPRFNGQLQKCEEFAVDRMSGDLDAAALEEVLRDRWSGPYALMFGTITSLSRIAVVILLPFLWAAVMHKAELHWVEGAGFYVLAAAIVITVFVGSTRLFGRLLRRRGHQDDGYWRQCIFPRLGRLIIVPMVLTVEVDHSYNFPAAASTWALLLLMMIAFLATQFFIKRLVRDESASLYEKRPLTEQQEQAERIKSRQAVSVVLPPLEEEKRPLTPAEQEKQDNLEKERDRAQRRKAQRVVAVALSYAFGAAMLFSIIFADSHHHPPASGASPVSDSHAKPHGDDAPDFLFVLPRRAFLDFAELSRTAGREPWSFVQEHGQFTYYPTLLLSWTAFGLFFGLVLEGIVKGESLMGSHKEEAE